MAKTIYVIQVYNQNGWIDIGVTQNKTSAITRAKKYSELWTENRRVRVILRLRNIKDVEHEMKRHQIQDEEEYMNEYTAEYNRLAR